MTSLARIVRAACLLAAACAVAAPACAQVFRNEIHLLGTATVPDSELLAGKRDGTTVGYDDAALVASRKAVREFLGATLKP